MAIHDNHDVAVVETPNMVAELVDQLPTLPENTSGSSIEEKSDEKYNEKQSSDGTEEFEADEKYLDDDGHEKVLETAEDFSTRLISLEDDPNLPIHTFRTWFIGLGLAAFGAVLGMLFQFRPQVISVSALFLQLLAYMMGKALEATIPGPGSRFHTGGPFWNFLNPGPFNIKEHVASQIMANTVCFTFRSTAVLRL